MAKGLVTVYMDSELIDAIKAKGTGVSAYIEKLVRASTEGELGIENPVLLKELTAAKELYGEQKENLDRLKDKIDGIDTMRKMERAKFFDGIMEVQNLTPEQLNNMEFMLELAGKIRDKTGKRIGVTQIKEYIATKK